MTDNQPTDKFDPQPSGGTTVEGRVMRLIEQRRHEGFAKYGTTMERTDLDEIAWLRHAQEEACDLAIYLQKLIDIKGGVPFDEPKEEPDGTLVIGGKRFVSENVHRSVQIEGQSEIARLRSVLSKMEEIARERQDEINRVLIGNAALRTQVAHFKSRAEEAEDGLRKLDTLEARPGPHQKKTMKTEPTDTRTGVAAAATCSPLPIRTAPRDGTAILLIEGDCIYKGKWDPIGHFWLIYCGQPACYQPEPTHWFPIPWENDQGDSAVSESNPVE